MIELQGVTHHYGVRPVLRDIEVTIRSGSTVAIAGPNGRGKSTLLNIMAGVVSPCAGSVRIGGLKRRGSQGDELAIRRQVVYLSDHPWLPSNQTGREFLIGVGRLYGIEDLRLLDHSERLLSLFHLSKEGDWPIRSYSCGQKKKIAIAATLITECPILLLDEPFGGGLDPSGILAFQQILKRMGESKDRTIVLTAPAPDLVNTLASDVLVLAEQEVALFASVEELRRQRNAPHQALSELLVEIIHPDTTNDVADYFTEMKL